MAVLDWADRTPRIERTVCLIHIHTTSVRPIAVAAKLGYKELARCNYREQPAFLLQGANVRPIDVLDSCPCVRTIRFILGGM